jgi:hypothetical protein
MKDWAPRDAILGLLGMGKSFSPEEICRMTGLTREMCSAALCEMEFNGEVKRNGKAWEKIFGLSVPLSADARPDASV